MTTGVAPAIARDGVGHRFFVERYEASREASPFNAQVSTRRDDTDGEVSYGGAARFRRTAAGIDQSELSGEALYSALVTEFEMSEEIVGRLRVALEKDA